MEKESEIPCRKVVKHLAIGLKMTNLWFSIFRSPSMLPNTHCT